MIKAPKHDVAAAARHFQFAGNFRHAEPYGSGHINDTYAATFEQGGVRTRYILQHINEGVFPAPEILMDNIQRVLQHQHRKLRALGADDIARRALTLIPAQDGRCFYRDSQGLHWRAYIFIEQAATYDVIASPAMAYQAAFAFGRFSEMLSDLPAPRLQETIPDFHHTPKRFAAFEQALAADCARRAARVRPEIDFALQRRKLTGRLVDAQAAGAVPERVTHNDTKLNNVMIDDATGAGICVIDLDTVMPGLSAYDFGDMVRTAACAGAEDERDLAKIVFRQDFFEALTRGYLEAAGAGLNAAEKKLLAPAAILITFEIGLRFLTDYLAGDVYFKTHRPDHNLDRCRTQFKMVQEMERRRDEMEACVARFA